MSMTEEVVKDKTFKIDYTPPSKSWMEPAVEFKKGTYGYPAASKHEKYLELPNPREWQPNEENWKLPKNWKEILLKGMKDRLSQYRSYRLFLDICVRCGACADKCHFFIGSGDPKNMPVLRTGIFFGSPEPMKKWHLSAQAPHLTQISRKSRYDRY